MIPKFACVLVAVLACFMIADSLDCNKCSVSIFGVCLNSATETCSTNTSVCFTGKAVFPSLTSFSGFSSQGCREPDGCNATTNGTVLGATLTTQIQCCSTDKCNPVTISGASTAQLSLAAGLVSAFLATTWSTL